MKRNVFLMFITYLLLLACSTNNDSVVVPNQIPNNNLLISKIFDNGIQREKNYVYVGNKLLEINYLDGKTKYFYNGNLIERIEEYNSSNVLIFNQIFSYNTNNDLETIFVNNLSPNYMNKTKYVYSYNNDGTVNFTVSDVNIINNIETIFSTNKYTFSNENLVKSEKLTSQGILFVDEFEYNSKFNAFRNILGFKKNHYLGIEVSKNNCTKWTRTQTLNSTGNNVTILNYQYTDNADNYPTQKETFYFNTSSLPISSVQYTY